MFVEKTEAQAERSEIALHHRGLRSNALSSFAESACEAWEPK